MCLLMRIGGLLRASGEVYLCDCAASDGFGDSVFSDFRWLVITGEMVSRRWIRMYIALLSLPSFFFIPHYVLFLFLYSFITNPTSLSVFFL